MKPSLRILFPCIALCLAIHPLFFHLQKKQGTLGESSQEAVRLIHKHDLFSAGTNLLHSSFVRNLINIDQSGQSILSKLLVKRTAQQIRHFSRSLSSRELIPQHAVAVLELSNAAASGKTFFASRFGQTVKGINWPAVFRRLNIKPSLHRPLEQNISGLLHLLTQPAFPQVFNRRLFLVQLPASLSLLQEKQLHPVSANLLIVLDAFDQENSDNSDESDMSLSALLNMFRGSRKKLNYSGVTVYAVQSRKRQKLYIASIGGKVLLSFARRPLQKSIALFLAQLINNKKNTLLINQEYTRLSRRRPEKTDFFVYADLFRLKLSLAFLLSHLASQEGDQAEMNRPWVPGVKSMGFYHWSENSIEQLRTVIHFSRKQLFPFQQHIYTTPPTLSHNFEEVPEDLLLSFWFNWLEPRLWWQTRIAHGRKEELASADRIAAWIQANTGMSMEEFLGLFGKNFSIHVAGISTAGFFPMPRLCFSIEIRDRKKVDTFFQKIIGDLPIRRTMSGGVPIISLLAAQGMLQPSYTFFNGYLLIADSREQIEDILLRKKTPLAEGKTFRAVDTELKQPANLHLFARTPEMVNALQELASWAGTMIAVRDHSAGATSKLLIDQIISPVLESFNTYSALGIRSATAPKELVLDAKLLPAQAEEP